MKLGALLGVMALCIAALVGTYVATREPGVKAAPPVRKPTDRPEGAPAIAATGPFPKANVDQSTFEFGVMGANEVRSHKFVIENKGEAPLLLKAGIPTCKCTVSVLKKEAVAPGESVDVEMSWQPKEMMMEFKQHVPLYTNDPENPEIHLTVVGNVAPLVTIEPPGDWEVGVLTDDKPVTLSGAVVTMVRDSFRIESVESSNPLLKAEVEPMPKEELLARRSKAGYKLKAVLLPGSPIGPITGTLTIKTDIQTDPKDPKSKAEFPIRLSGNRSGPYRLMALPGTKFHAEVMAIDMGEFDAAKGKSARFLLFVLDMKDQDFEITRVETDTPFLKVNLKRDTQFKAGDRQKYDLTFEAPPDSPKVSMIRTGAARVTLHTNHPLAPEMKFRIELISQ